MNSYIKWIDKVNRLLVALMGILLVVMTLAVTYQVLLRFLLPKLGIKMSAPWTGELPIYCMIWLILLGAAVAVRNGHLITVDVIHLKLSARASKIVTVIALGFSILFYICILIAGYQWALFGLSETSVSMKLSMFYIYLSLPLSAVMMILNGIAYLLELLFNKNTNVNSETDYGI